MKGLMYTIIFFLALVLPALFVSSYILKSDAGGKEYVLTYSSGNSSIQYERAGFDAEFRKWYRKKAKWIPLVKGMRAGSGDRVRTDLNSFADIMREGRVAFRIQEKSMLEFGREDPSAGEAEVALNYGTAVFHVMKAEDQKFSVRTPTAVVRVKGTSFLVSYLPEENETHVKVLEGTVNVATLDGSRRKISLREGRKMKTGPLISRPAELTLASADQEAMEKTCRDMQTDDSGIGGMLGKMDLDVFSPVLNKIITQITESEMRTFIKELKYTARFRRGGKLPAAIKDIELEEGDYEDPWHTEYVYEKIGASRAVLMSAGPDKTLNTRDDIVLTICF